MAARLNVYAERIERVLDHLERSDPAEPPPSLADLAATAAMSAYHFHRIFRLMTGETVNEVVQRVRIARSLPLLAAGQPITSAAGVSGYGSSQSYARAFRAVTENTPHAVRADGKLLIEVADALRSPGSASPLDLTIVSLDPIRLLAVRRSGDYADLNAGYHQLFEAVLGQLAPENILGLYGLPHDDPRFTPAEECTFDCAVAVGMAGAPLGPLSELHVGGGEWLRLRHHGNYDDIHAAIDGAYAAAILAHDRAIADRPLFLHFLDDPEEVEEANLRADIYLALA